MGKRLRHRIRWRRGRFAGFVGDLDGPQVFFFEAAFVAHGGALVNGQLGVAERQIDRRGRRAADYRIRGDNAFAGGVRFAVTGPDAPAFLERIPVTVRVFGPSGRVPYSKMTKKKSRGLSFFWVALVRSWPYVRAVFIVWAVCSVTGSLSQIARNLERVVNRWDLEKEASRTPAKPSAGK